MEQRKMKWIIQRKNWLKVNLIILKRNWKNKRNLLMVVRLMIGGRTESFGEAIGVVGTTATHNSWLWRCSCVAESDRFRRFLGCEVVMVLLCFVSRKWKWWPWGLREEEKTKIYPLSAFSFPFQFLTFYSFLFLEWKASSFLRVRERQ